MSREERPEQGRAPGHPGRRRSEGHLRPPPARQCPIIIDRGHPLAGQVCPGFPRAGMSGRKCHGAIADDRGVAANDDLGDPAVLFVRGALQGAGAPHGHALVDLNTVGAVLFR
jgi:hypothetical protein